MVARQKRPNPLKSKPTEVYFYYSDPRGRREAYVYNVLIKLIVVASLLELGISVSKIGECSSRACWSELQRASHKVMRIDWKPVSVFTKEAERFRQPAQ